MPVFTAIDQTTKDRLWKDNLVLEQAAIAHVFALKLSASNEAFWHLPTDRLLALLNADIPATLQTFALNTQIGIAINAVLDAVVQSGGAELAAKFSARVPLEYGRNDIEFDQATNRFRLKETAPASTPTPVP